MLGGFAEAVDRIGVLSMTVRGLTSTFVRGVGCVLFLITLAACGSEEVVTDLDQRAANSAVSILNQYGISASKQSVGRGANVRYSLSVRAAQLAEAVSVLSVHDIPAEREPESFADLTAQRGLVPNSREVEALRLDHALALQIEALIANLPGVRSVSALVRSNILNARQIPQASITMKKDQGVTLESQTVARLVKAAIPGIGTDTIGIEVSDVVTPEITLSSIGVQNVDGVLVHVPLRPFLRSYRVPEGDYRGLIFLLSGMFTVCGVVFSLFGFLVGYRYQLFQRYLRRNGGVTEMPRPNGRSIKTEMPVRAERGD